MVTGVSSAGGAGPGAQAESARCEPESADDELPVVPLHEDERAIGGNRRMCEKTGEEVEVLVVPRDLGLRQLSRSSVFSRCEWSPTRR